MSSSLDNSLKPARQNVDLVLFSNILPVYSASKSITANYLLGESLESSSWDWVGIFDVNWTGLGEYNVYCWATSVAQDCTSPRKRTLSIPNTYHCLQPDPIKKFQLLYVSGGNDVIGASAPFLIEADQEEGDLYIDRMFDAMASQSYVSSSGGYLPSDSYELINEVQQPTPSRFSPRKKKMTAVYRDNLSLTSDFTTVAHWSNALRLSDTQSVVKEYLSNDVNVVNGNDVTDIVPYGVRVPVFDLAWKRGSNRPAGQIEFPVRLPILPGPSAFTIASRESKDTCTGCRVAKVIITDLLEKTEINDVRIKSIEKDMLTLRHRPMEQKQAIPLFLKEKTEPHDTMPGSYRIDVMDLCIQTLQADNRALREKMEDLERSLAEEKAQNVRDGRLLQLPRTDREGWSVKESKRIARLQRTVCRQENSLTYLRDCVSQKDFRTDSLKKENGDLRKRIKEEHVLSQQAHREAQEVNAHIQAILAERSKNKIKAWQLPEAAPNKQPQLTTGNSSTNTVCPSSPETSTNTKGGISCLGSTSSNSGTSSTSSKSGTSGTTSNSGTSYKSSTISISGTCSKIGPSNKEVPKPLLLKGCKIEKAKNKQIAKVLKSEAHHRSKLHKERSQEEQCPTCGIKFSSRADPRVIEEHLQFHTRFRM